MKRLCFPVIFSVCIAGCLVDSGCAAIGSVVDQTAVAAVRSFVPGAFMPKSPTPADEATKAELAALKVAADRLEATVNEPIVPETVPTWLAALGVLGTWILPSKGVGPLSKSVGKRLLKMLSIKTK